MVPRPLIRRARQCWLMHAADAIEPVGLFRRHVTSGQAAWGKTGEGCGPGCHQQSRQTRTAAFRLSWHQSETEAAIAVLELGYPCFSAWSPDQVEYL